MMVLYDEAEVIHSYVESEVNAAQILIQSFTANTLCLICTSRIIRLAPRMICAIPATPEIAHSCRKKAWFPAPVTYPHHEHHSSQVQADMAGRQYPPGFRAGKGKILIQQE